MKGNGSVRSQLEAKFRRGTYLRGKYVRKKDRM
jgi:hypothetical protein